MYRRQDAIRAKGFAMTDSRHTYEDPALPVDYGKIRVGL
uniref:Ephrin type-A receptor 2 n=1 Tax=Siphoviridae sp. ctxMM9 TaxID=2827973 RepID=A0A8S5T6M3_9CAUD|nr:MAG TPA: Ephrin type-A receptor 2 [Siphoviridae sp. ctxMM9]